MQNTPEIPHEIETSNFPMAASNVGRRWAPRIVWIIPIIAVLIGINLAVKAVLERGETITIGFISGEGIEAGKTHVKYKDVEIGLVKKVALSPDHQQVIASVLMEKDAIDFLKEDTRFWIVSPRITAKGVSGLNTLLAGPFIGADIGQSTKECRNFTALNAPPIHNRDKPGREFVLRAPNLGSIDIGAPVYFRRMSVGEVLSYELDKDGKSISFKIFVNAPYDHFVTSNTRFWNASGIDVLLGADGIQVKTESLVSLLVGGIAFEAPQDNEIVKDSNCIPSLVPKDINSTSAARAEAYAEFPLFSTRLAAMKRPDSITQRFVINFKQSVRGLSVGAPVDFRGVTIGEVVSVDAAIDPKTFEVVQPVEIYLYPDRLHPVSLSDGVPLPYPKTPEGQLNQLQMLLSKGLRAQLNSGNLLTGQQYIALDFFPDAPKYTLNVSRVPLEMPSIPNALEDMQKSVASLSKNLDKLTASNSPLLTNMRNSLVEITQAAASIKALADMLEKQPQSLIFGKSRAKPKNTMAP